DELTAPVTLAATPYGRILAAKLAAVAALLMLAALNRLRLTRRAEFDPRPLSRSIAAEGVLVLAILGLTAGWRFTPPPHAVATTRPVSAKLHVHGEKGGLLLAMTPGRRGPNAVRIDLFDADMQPLKPKEVTLTLSLPSAGIEAMRREARPDAAGGWSIDAFL